MSAWQRIAPLEGSLETVSEEVWVYTSKKGVEHRYPMRVTNGKPFNVLSLKGTNLQEIRDYADFLHRTADCLYAQDSPYCILSACPCCGANTNDHVQACYSFIGVPLHRCNVCGHGFVLKQPKEQAFTALFAESDHHSAPYIDQASVEARMQEIIAPKINWSLEVYAECYNQQPRHSLDVGAGGGHFVEGLRRAGLNADGYELSRASRQFAKDAFGVELLSKDFLTAIGETVDLVTFWGLLEYTPEPRRFFEAARQRLKPNSGLLVVEVPRLNCLGTAAQAANPASIARHMDPTSHVNTFSDASLATALVETGFKPVAAWYFGMDIYELLIQAALRLNDTAVVEHLADMIPILQQTLDVGRQCDDLVLAAVPVNESFFG